MVPLVLAAALVTTGCGGATGQQTGPTGPTTTFARQPTAGFVTASGRQFLVDGKPFRFVGVNMYDAAATSKYSCNPTAAMTPDELKSAFATLHDSYGVTVVRFWAYQTYTDGGRDFSGVDQVVAAAKATGIRLLPVLEDGPGYCTTLTPASPKAQYEGDSWFTEGYKKQYGTAALSFRDYAKVMVEHYRDEPTIFAWSLVNEADTSARDDQNRSVLVDFATDMAGVVKAADSRHLLTLGTQSNGAAGASGSDFTAVYRVPGLDFAEVHDWGYWGSDDQPMPGGSGSATPDPNSAACQQIHAKVGCSFAMAVALGKPLVVGEAGMDRGSGNAVDLGNRATKLNAKMSAAFAAGASGYLLWRVTRTVTDQYDITLDDHDPVLDDLSAQARALGN